MDSHLQSLTRIMILIIGLNLTVHAGGEQPAPANVQAALFTKLLGMNKNFDGKSITIYVVGASDFAGEMKKAVGKKSGAATIASVDEGNGVPGTAPNVIYVADEQQAGDIMNYCAENKVLSITGNPGLVGKGITLGVGVAGGKPKVLLNAGASKKEGISWNPAILKIASKVD